MTESQTVSKTGSRARIVMWAFASETLLAGANGVAIRFSNRELAPVWGAGLRFVMATVLIIIVMVALRQPLPRGKALFGAMLFGLFQFAGAFGFAYYALVEIQAGLGQTLLALVPLATLLLAVAQRQERLRRVAVLGSLLGLLGIGLVSIDPGREPIPVLSLLALLASVLCFAQALVLVRRLPPMQPVALNTVGMITGAAVLLGTSFLLGEPWTLPERSETWVAIFYVAAIGSVAVFLLHVFIAQNWGASRAAYVMVAIPLITIVLSAWLDQEPVTSGLLLCGMLVVAGVYLGALRDLPK
jgi:drug/metabolite transporter (DMT)-like permease